MKCFFLSCRRYSPAGFFKLKKHKKNEYFVAGNLLCARWVENGTENREWWEMTIDGDTMNWTALREVDDGSTFTATFEMSKVEN